MSKRDEPPRTGGGGGGGGDIDGSEDALCQLAAEAVGIIVHSDHPGGPMVGPVETTGLVQFGGILSDDVGLVPPSDPVPAPPVSLSSSAASAPARKRGRPSDDAQQPRPAKRLQQRTAKVGCKCRGQCYSVIIGEENAARMRKEFEEKTHEEQQKILIDLIVRKEVPSAIAQSADAGDAFALSEPASPASPVLEPMRRRHSLHVADAEYFVVVNGERRRVCRQAFLHVFGVGASRLSKLARDFAARAPLQPDQRGRHTNRPTKLPESIRDQVRRHIAGFPRNKITPVTQMYQNFCDVHGQDSGPRGQGTPAAGPAAERGRQIVTLHFYRDVFVSEFKDGFWE